MPLASVEAVQVSDTEEDVLDTAVRPRGMEGGVASSEGAPGVMTPSFTVEVPTGRT